MIALARSARRWGAAAVFALVLFGAGAVAVAAAARAPDPAPRDVLQQALRQVQALGSRATGAAAELTQATARQLWINSREADAAPYGRNVFIASAAAVKHLEAASPTTATGLILRASRDLAQNAIAEANGGHAALVTTARKALSVGNREAHAGDALAAVDSYAAAWQAASDALTRLVAAEVTHVPSVTLAAAAGHALAGTRFGMSGPEIKQSLPPLSVGGKPEVFYAGSEACPFCGVQRWGMIAALSQFGTFSNLHLMQSVPTTPPQVTTFTFFGSSYHSPYISFVPVEVWSNVPAHPGLVPLQSLTHPESVLVNRFDPAVETPFIDVANRFIIDSSTVTPQLIAHKSWTQLAGGLTDPSNVSTQAIAGEAEVLTAEVCEATGGSPASVCSSAVVQQYEAALPTLTGKGGSCPAPRPPGGPPPGGPPPGGPPPTRDAARGPAAPVATAARCQV